MSKPSPKTEVVAVGFIILATLIAYIPAIRGGFVWDDDAYVYNNKTLRSADGLRQIWFDFKATPQYYPMVHTSYWLEYRLWGLNPAGYHIINVLLHVISVVLLWRILTILQVPGALVVAAIFAIHPVHVESVAWITERKNVLSGVFYLGAALCYLRYAFIAKDSSSFRGRVRFYVASLVLFVCALFSKTVACTLPVALLLMLWWKRKRISLSNIRTLIPFFVIGITFGLLTVWLEKHRVGAVGVEWEFSIVERCLIAGRAVCFYATKLIWPRQLTFIYPRWNVDAGIWWQYVFLVVVLIASVALWLGRNRFGTGPFVAVLFFTITLAPALGFFNVYPFRYSFVADHFQYLASIGLIVLVVITCFLMAARLGSRAKIAAKVVVILVLLVLGTLTWNQCHIYKDRQSLWQDTLKKSPRSFMACNNLGAILYLQGEVDRAVSYFREAIKIYPDYAEAHNNLAFALATYPGPDLYNPNEAIYHVKRAIELQKYADLTTLDTLAAAYAAAGQFEKAVTFAEKALQLADAHKKLEDANEITERLELYRQGKPYRLSTQKEIH